jgi:endo-1,4-beta-xylanase
MRTHIHTVMKRYKGKIKYWDVVNEAVVTRMIDDESLPLDEEGNPQKKQIAVYRDSPWMQIIGEDYLELAFKFAHEADPDAKLLYNDYSMTGKPKAEFVANMVKGLKAKGVPVHGIGMQGHWHLDYPQTGELQEAITILAGTGAKIHITELEIGVLPNAHNHTGADINDIVEPEEDLNPYVNGVPPEVLEQHALKYQDIFRVLIGNRDRIERVTLWGISDGYSWKNDYPVRGRTDFPLLFDRQHQPKPAYNALLELAPNEN